MARGRFSDFTDQEIRKGDFIVYWSRRDNATRGVEAEVLRVYAERHKGRLIPMLKVLPTGRQTGHAPRKTIRVETITTEQMVVVARAEDLLDA